MRIAGGTIDDLERASAKQTPTSGAAASASKPAGAVGDTVMLSNAGQRARAGLEAGDAARAERIEALRQQVARGEYSVDLSRLADAMIREEGARSMALGEAAR